MFCFLSLDTLKPNYRQYFAMELPLKYKGYKEVSCLWSSKQWKNLSILPSLPFVSAAIAPLWRNGSVKWYVFNVITTYRIWSARNRPLHQERVGPNPGISMYFCLSFKEHLTIDCKDSHTARVKKIDRRHALNSEWLILLLDSSVIGHISTSCKFSWNCLWVYTCYNWPYIANYV